jgi:glyoxalase superfamily protein
VARVSDIVFDCGHPASLARFWAQVLDGYAVAPYDDAELERLRGMGIDDVEDDPTVLVEGPPDAPRYWFQLVPETKVVKNRVHVDLRADDVDAEVARLVGLGATVIRPDGGRDGRIVVLQDPEGNEFCLLR